MTERDFTAKSLAFGVISLLIVCAFPIYSEKVLKMEGAIRGYLPVVPLFLIVLLSGPWNGIAGRLSPRLALGSRELAVVFGLMLMTAWIPGLQNSLVRHLVLPRYEELTTNLTWKEAGVTTRLPAALFPAGQDGSAIDENVHFGFIQGGLAADAIPFGAWWGPLLRWAPVLVLLSLGLLALSLLVHRQWTCHEQLRYPLATVADALIRQDPRRPGGAIYRNRLFWFGFVFVFGFNLIHYLNDWFPNQLPKVAIEYYMGWWNLLPVIAPDQSNAALFCLHWMYISLAIIGIAYFVPSDVSLSIGLTAPLGTLIGVQYYLASGRQLSSENLDTFRSGGFIALGLILLYTGRTYYFPILWRALVPRRGQGQADPGEVWAARIFLAAYAGLIAVFHAMGIDLLIAALYVTFLLLVFLVVTRLVCETGVPTIAPAWSLPALMSGLFGPAAIGAAPLIFMSLLSRTLADSTQLIMPYMATSLKILDDQQVRLRRFAVVAKAAILLALVAGFVATLTVSYMRGQGNLLNEERGVLARGASEVLNLKELGQLSTAEAAHGLAKLPLMRAQAGTLGWVAAGVVGVLITYALRFRFAGWPLHPLFLILLGTFVGQSTWFCFLLGWGIKSLVVKFGGGRAYNALKPLFVGVIVGEFLCLALGFVVGLLYHLLTGGTPPVEA